MMNSCYSQLTKQPCFNKHFTFFNHELSRRFKLRCLNSRLWFTIDHRLKENIDSNEVVKERIKVALLLAYNGQNYHGVMMNRGDRTYPTIEKELILTLLKTKLISQECWEKPPKMHFVIASRTDKGVSTCGQVISLFLPNHDDLINLINNHLPPDIRVLGVQRAIKSFSCWRFADLRDYSYTLPTFAFAHSKDCSENYSITQDKLQHIRSLGYRYKGAHSFHNFTTASNMGDDTAVRAITGFEAGIPVLEKSIEFITLKFSGRSFLLHQIRHMVGLIIAIVSGRAGENLYVRAFSERNAAIPFAPSSGLVLEKIYFCGYNKKFSKVYGDLDFLSAEKKVNEFRETQIMPSIYENEIKNKNMMNWLNTIDDENFSTQANPR